MKKFEIYEAFDGTKFNSEEECLNYEAKMEEENELLNVCWMKREGKITDKIGLADELFIPTHKAANAFYRKFYDYGYALPWEFFDEASAGHWRWDYDDEKWVVFDSYACPNCGSQRFEVTDYDEEIPAGEFIVGVQCKDCGTDYDITYGPIR